MDYSFILQVTREIGLGGGSECVAFELQPGMAGYGHRCASSDELRDRTGSPGRSIPDGILAKEFAHRATSASSGHVRRGAVLHVGGELARMAYSRIQDCVEPRRFLGW